MLHRFSGWLIGRFDIKFADIAMVCMQIMCSNCMAARIKLDY